MHIQAIEWESAIAEIVKAAGLYPRPDIKDEFICFIVERRHASVQAGDFRRRLRRRRRQEVFG